MNRRIRDTGDFYQVIIEVELNSKFLGQEKNSNVKIFLCIPNQSKELNFF